MNHTVPTPKVQSFGVLVLNPIKSKTSRINEVPVLSAGKAAYKYNVYIKQAPLFNLSFNLAIDDRPVDISTECWLVRDWDYREEDSFRVYLLSSLASKNKLD